MVSGSTNACLGCCSQCVARRGRLELQKPHMVPVAGWGETNERIPSKHIAEGGHSQQTPPQLSTCIASRDSKMERREGNKRHSALPWAARPAKREPHHAVVTPTRGTPPPLPHCTALHLPLCGRHVPDDGDVHQRGEGRLGDVEEGGEDGRGHGGGALCQVEEPAGRGNKKSRM